MLQSLFKLVCIGMGILGPWGAGVLWHYVRFPEIYAIFLIGGTLLGIGGMCGFASTERSERALFRRRLGREGRS